MKSLFKRTLAAASGSVLCLTQIAAAAVNVNISAADTPYVIDKEAVLYVPIPDVNPEIATKEGREQPSDWNDKLDTALSASEAKEVEVYGVKAREFAEKQIKRLIKSSNRYGAIFTDADVDAVMSRIRLAKGVVNPDGTAEATVSLGDISDIVAEIVERNYQERTPSGQIRDGYGHGFTIDWTNFEIAGYVTTTAQVDYDTKTVKYETVFTDETGKTYKDDEIENYVLAKIDEGQQLILSCAEAQGCTTDKIAAQMAKRADKAKAYDGYIRNLVEEGAKINVSGSDIETVYADYMAAVDAAIENAEVPEHLVSRIEGAIDKRQPATALQVLDSPRVNDWAERAVNAFNNRYGSTVTVDLSTADVKAIAAQAYDWDITINGYCAYVDFSLPDDQHADLLAAIHASLDATYAAEQKRIVDVISHKEVSASAQTTYGTSGELYYDVIRVIDEIVVEDIIPEETTTTTEETTTSEGETTTTIETTTSEGETTTTEETTTSEGVTTTTEESTTVTDVTTTTKVNPDETTTTTDVTTTTKVNPDETTTTTDVTTTTKVNPDETTTTTDVTTTTKVNPDETTTTTDVTTTTKVNPDETTTTSTDTTPEVTTTTTTEETTTTTAATYVSFEVNGISKNNLVYWSEETSAFDLSELSVKLHFVLAGVDQPNVVDVTEYFKPEATNPSELTLGEGLGYDYVPVYVVLTDEAAVQQIIRDNGYGDELIEQEQLYNGKQVDKLHVYLTLRGDTDLDGKITALDAQFANLYFLETVVLGKTAEDLLEDPDSAYLNRLGEMRAELFQFSHYACDTHDGNGEISALDSQDIRMYFLENTVLDSGTEWNEIANSDVVPFDDLHAAPLGRDEYVAHTDGWQLTEAPAEEQQG